jgi:hypothetical protein
MGIAGGTPDTPAPYVVIANMVLNLWSRLNILLAMPKRLWPIFQISRMFSHKFKLVSFYK